ncbi:HPr(Ser) kinase/phosphatase [Aerococcus sanguinicola]|uniref:HPr kinase/phosphorylase n=1 Tax=Aerococcus sanguinicola TaxID=119206 RepID=A0A0X8FD27_9LACT|nr:MULTISPECIES: HPr(Ser) kinase/phosphatase [Aerococcus]AMB94297.1 serine kinase [Aerococcus sanguinicola]MDK7049922.1 HPr(Ser) kinase/phosphatase [Aerococcus sanguinicola]OFT92612.1 HPr kinase/phosphorylase [Aerococcus sp. HMSC23C02]PKZ22473.1 HPr kinase/phosphorylase [Aerococcus sanguinicola]
MAVVTVRELVEALKMNIISGEDYLDREITVSDISRPGLELTGYFNYYPEERIQLFGRNEHSFMSKMTSEERLLVMRRLARDKTPVFVFSRDLRPEYEVIQAANENHIPVIGINTSTTHLSSRLTTFLQERLATRTSRHGVFVEVYGLGVLIMGESGVGKSEAALELVKNGHRLVADDRVELYQRDEYTIMGEAPAILENMMEIRGLGIINIMTLYGAGAVRQKQQVNLIIQLKLWHKEDKYDRLGTAAEEEDIFGVKVAKITVPVQMGRNISSIVEVAAMNFRANDLGYNSAKEFEDRLTHLIESNSQEEG